MTKLNKIVAVYPGTFDPITNGHTDVILRASNIVDELVIGVSTSFTKSPMFSIQQRCDFIKETLATLNGMDNVRIEPFSGLLVNFANEIGAKLIIRGLRVVSDFEYEFQMACMNSRLDDKVETVFLPASEKNQFISSRLVKEVASLKGNIMPFVNPQVEKAVTNYYLKQDA